MTLTPVGGTCEHPVDMSRANLQCVLDDDCVNRCTMTVDGNELYDSACGELCVACGSSV